jgi:large subunit ribosomal protein L6
MSRIGKLPITIPSGTTVKLEGDTISVKGAKGLLERKINPDVTVNIDGDTIRVERHDDTKKSRSLQGLTRALIANMVHGVSQGFKKELLVNGVGYKVDVKGKQLVMHLGFSHPIEFDLPEGISVKVEKQKEIHVILEGYDKELLGLTAARIRQYRPPEPYKGKGIIYSDETIIRKAGKAAA